MSLNVDYSNPDYAHNDILDNRAAYGSVTDRDGERLYGLLVEERPAFNGLIGVLNEDTLDKPTRYVAVNYQDQLLPKDNYSLWTGIEKSTAQVTLTISAPLQEAMYQYLTSHGARGTITAYDYQTGDLLCLVSTPGDYWSNAENAQASSYVNKCLYTTTPGSTMKLVTLYLAVCQGIDVSQLTFTCQGSYTLQADSGVVTCTGTHGAINGVTALGQSCNCWFAQLVEQLDLDQAKATLKEMGFEINHSGSTSLGRLPRSCSQLTIDNKPVFSTVWNLIGQDSALVSPLDMVTLAGLYASGGTALQPRLTAEEPAESYEYGQAHGEEFETLRTLWRQAYTENYNLAGYSSLISAAKTGTCDKLGTEANRTQKLLCGYSEELHVAFYVVLENYREGDSVLDIQAVDAANELMNQIQVLHLTVPQGTEQ